MLKQISFFLFFFLITNGIIFAETKTVPKDVAKKMGEVQMLYHGRICPLETFAQDFTLNLYGKSTYKSLSCEQVLCGWLFYPENWKNEPIIKRKDKKIQLLFLLKMEDFLKVFPIKQQDNLVWYSPTDALPDNLSENETLLIRGFFDILQDYAVEKDWNAMKITLNQLIAFQQKTGKGELLSPQKMKAEHLYNKIKNTKPLAFCHLFLGIFAMIYFFRNTSKNILMR